MDGALQNDSTATLASPTYKTPSPLRIILYAICIAGIMLNIGVLFQIIKTVKKHSTVMRLSLSLLCSMAAADTVSLAALLLMLNAKYISRNNFSAMNLLCKLDLFLIHASSAYSLWCWLVLSAVRYLAIYRPYIHMQLSKEPFFAAVAVAAMCLFMESWILFEVQFIPELKSCGDSVSEELARQLQVAEIIWSYFLPLIVITVLDTKVLCRHLDWWTSSSVSRIPTNNSMQQLRSNKQSRRQLLQRFLAITIVDLGLNLPNYLVRLWINLATEEQFGELSGIAMIMIEDISQLLYFGQFALNALYLMCIVYDVPRRNSRASMSPKYAREFQQTKK